MPHALEYDSRLQVYNWLRKHLQGKPAPIEEEPLVAPEADETLWVCESGNLAHSLRSRTPFQINRSRKVEKTPITLEHLLRVDRPAPSELKVLRRVPAKGVWIEAVEVAADTRVWVPAWLFRPRSADEGKPVLVLLDASGRNARVHEGELYQSLALKGYIVCVPDLRGIGDMTPGYSRGAPSYARAHQDEEGYAWASLILGRPLIGQRVTDILAVAGSLRRNQMAAGRRLMVAALGRLTVPALFAAALDPKIEGLYLAGGLVSYRSVVETEEYNTPLASLVPGVLQHTDLPETAATLAPRRVCLAGSVNAAGSPINIQLARTTYPSANVDVRDRALWDVESLSL